MAWRDSLGNTTAVVGQDIYYGFCGDGVVDNWNNEKCDL